VIEIADVRRRWSEWRGGEAGIVDSERKVVGVGVVVVAEYEVAVVEGHDHLGGAGVDRYRPRGLAVDEPGRKQPIPRSHRLQGARAQLDPVLVQEVDADVRPGRINEEAAEVATQREGAIAGID